MAEPARRSETFRAGPPVTLGSTRLLIIERTVTQATPAGRGLWCWSDRTPHALVIREHGRVVVRAVDADAVPIPLDALLNKVPGLAGLLASL